MGCAQSQRGVVDHPTDQTVIFDGGNGTTGNFEAVKISVLAVDDYIYTCFRDDGEEPPFAGSNHSNGDKVITLDGAPEGYGGGSEVWYQIELDNGEYIDVPENALLPALGAGWSDVLAKDLEIGQSLVVIEFDNSNAIGREVITGIVSTNTTVNLHHPLFETTAESTYYAAARRGEENEVGILVATCLGEF
jgi:hypothetical protein